jgi:MFS family permease
MPPRSAARGRGCGCCSGGGADCGVIGSGNVRLAFYYNIASAVGGSIVSSSVFLSTYIFYLDGANNANVDVGLVSATAGVTMVALAVPAGLLTDALPRASVLRASGVAGLAGSALLFAALLAPAAAPRTAMALLYAASALSGAYSALSGPALASILADSVASGQRTRVYALQYAATLAAGAAGPLIGIFLLLWLGDVWASPQLRAVMLAGAVVNALACGFAFCFDDAQSLGSESEGALAAAGRGAPGGAAGAAAGGDAGDAAAGLLASAAAADGAAAEAGAGAKSATEEEGESPAETRRRARRNLGHQTLPLGCCTLRVRHVPWLLFASDFTIAVGAGMTVGGAGATNADPNLPALPSRAHTLTVRMQPTAAPLHPPGTNRGPAGAVLRALLRERGGPLARRRLLHLGRVAAARGGRLGRGRAARAPRRPRRGGRALRRRGHALHPRPRPRRRAAALGRHRRLPRAHGGDERELPGATGDPHGLGPEAAARQVELAREPHELHVDGQRRPRRLPRRQGRV